MNIIERNEFINYCIRNENYFKNQMDGSLTEYNYSFNRGCVWVYSSLIGEYISHYEKYIKYDDISNVLTRIEDYILEVYHISTETPWCYGSMEIVQIMMDDIESEKEFFDFTA